MSTPTSKMSSSQLAALEQAFGSAPTSEAWRPLAEAYLAANRHLEANVIAKKAIRSRPGDPAPRVLIARVLAAQGKSQKAKDELLAVRKAHPDDAAARALALELGLEQAGAPAPAASAPEATANASTAAGRGKKGSPPHLDPGYAQDLSRRYGEERVEPASLRRASAKRALLRTAALAASLAVVLGVGGALAAARRARGLEVEKLLAESRPLLEKDTWPALRDAATRCDRAASLHADSAEAHACAAWASIVRLSDHGDAEGRDAVKKHLAALPADRMPARGAAAAALQQVAEGDPRGAVSALRPLAAKDQSAVLQAALGEALLAAGDLDGARDALSAAQRLAPGDVRTLRLVAEQLRRRGGADASQAEILYDVALARLAPDHPGALLGKARLLVDRKAGPEALALADKVAGMSEAASPRQRAAAQAIRARALAVAGKKDEAARAQKAALALDPGGREVKDILGGAPVASVGR